MILAKRSFYKVFYAFYQKCIQRGVLVKNTLTNFILYDIIHNPRYKLAIGQASLQTTVMVVYRFNQKGPSRLFSFLLGFKKMNVYLEIFGYIGTALVIVSMMMKSINRLRIFNIAGSVISTIYSIIAGAWPIVVMNVSLIAINSYHLIKAYADKENKQKGLPQ